MPDIYGTAGNVGAGSPPPETAAYLEWLRQNAGNMGGGDAGNNNYVPPPAEVQAEIDRQNTLKPIVINGVEHFQLGPASAGGDNPYDDRHVDYSRGKPTYDPTYGWVAPSASFNQRESMGQNLLQTLAQSGIAAAYGGAALQGAGLFGGEGAGWMSDGGFGAGGLAPEEAAMGHGASWASGGGFGAGGLAPEEAAGLFGNSSPAAGASGPGPSWADGGGFGSGGIDPNTASGAGGMGFGQNGIGPGGSGLWDTISNAVTKDPLRAAQFAAGLGNTVGGLFGSKPNSSGSSGSGSLSSGLFSTPTARPQYKPNEITLRQFQQLYGGR